jgi:hypothetical protein
MPNPLRAAETIGGKVLAVVLGSFAGLAIGALIGFLLFAAGEALGEAFFGFGGFGDGPFVEMAPRSRLRGGFLILGAAAGIPGSWWVMWRMARGDREAPGE